MVFASPRVLTTIGKFNFRYFVPLMVPTPCRFRLSFSLLTRLLFGQPFLSRVIKNPYDLTSRPTPRVPPRLSLHY